MHDQSAAPDLNDWVPSSHLSELYPHFSKSVVEYLLRERENNGLEDAVRVIGRTRYISLRRFAEWVEKSSRRTRSGGSRARGSDLQSKGQASNRKASTCTEHTTSTKRHAARKI